MTRANGGGRRKRILILGRAVFGERMSSPGIRARHMAEVLCAGVPDAQVTLGIPRYSPPWSVPDDLPYKIVRFSMKDVPGLIWSHDIIICNDYPPAAVATFPWKKYVLDYYTIYYIEWMEIGRDARVGASRTRTLSAMGARQRRIIAELLFGDFVLVANERQKDYYLGAAIALGLIEPEHYNRDPNLDHYIAAAPHGIRPDALPEHASEPAMRGVYAGIRETDRIMIWNGGILQWYDPLSLLRALARVVEKRDDIKLVFVGGAYPGLGSMGLETRFQETVELAKELGLYNRHVFFDLSWVPYERMKDYMVESDAAVCTYFDNAETHFSLRTRFVDVFWAELPLICTHGDVLADMVAEKELGVVVPERDADAIADAIERLFGDDEFYERCRANLRALKPELQWDVTLQPLVEYCRNPQSSALPKWRRTFLLAGAWALWGVATARSLVVGK